MEIVWNVILSIIKNQLILELIFVFLVIKIVAFVQITRVVNNVTLDIKKFMYQELKFVNL